MTELQGEIDLILKSPRVQLILIFHDGEYGAGFFESSDWPRGREWLVWRFKKEDALRDALIDWRDWQEGDF